MDLGSNESIQVFSINEGNDSFSSLVLEDLVAKKEDGIHILWETWNIAHRSVLISLREKDTVMQKIVKEKDALATLKLTLLQEKNALKDKQIEKIQEILEEKQTMTKEEQQSNEPKCSTPIKGIHKRDFGFKRKTPTSAKSRIIGLKSIKGNLNLTKNLDQNKVAKKSCKNDETLNVRRNHLIQAVNQSSFQVDDEDYGIMENKPIYKIQEESMMEDTRHINDAFDDDRDEFGNEPVYVNMRPRRLSNISWIPPRNADNENQISGRLSNISPVSYRNAKKENQVSGRFFNFIPTLQRNKEKENRAPHERLSNISSIPHRNGEKENEVFVKLPNINTDTGSRIEKQIANVLTTIIHLQEDIQTLKGVNQGLFSQKNQISTNGGKCDLSYRVSQLEKEQFQYRIEKLVDDKIKSLDSLIDEKAKSLDKLVDGKIKTLNRQMDDKVMSVDKSIEHRIRSEIKYLDYNIGHQSRFSQNSKDLNKNTRDIDILFKEKKILSDKVRSVNERLSDGSKHMSNLTSGNNETITIVNRNTHDIADIFSELSKIKINIENHDLIEGSSFSLTSTPPSPQEKRRSTSPPSPRVTSLPWSDPSDSIFLTEQDQSFNLDVSDNSICGPAIRLAASILEIQHFNEITDPHISVSARQAICSSPALRSKEYLI